MNELPESVEVLVVGAGPAGSTVARIVAARGHSVLLIDSARAIGQPVRCAEYAPARFAESLPAASPAVAARVHSCRLHWEGATETYPMAGCLLRREILDKWLAVEAARAGATVLADTRYLGRPDARSAATVQFAGRERLVRYDVLVGADGPHSMVRRALGLPAPQLIFARQFEVALKDDCTAVDFFFRPHFVGGYGWVFAKGRTANVGVGSTCTVSRELLEEFLAADVAPHFACTGIVRSLAAPVPAHDPELPLVHGDVLLVGDAAGQVDNLTYGGLLPSRCGALAAGQAIIEALDHHDPSALDSYPRHFQQRCGAMLRSAFDARRELTDHWEQYETILRKVWVVRRRDGTEVREGEGPSTRRRFLAGWRA